MSVPNPPLVVGDHAYYHNWSANRLIVVEIVEALGARFRVKHLDQPQIFSANRGALKKVPDIPEVIDAIP